MCGARTKHRIGKTGNHVGGTGQYGHYPNDKNDPV
jgi:hypothetical protein